MDPKKNRGSAAYFSVRELAGSLNPAISTGQFQGLNNRCGQFSGYRPWLLPQDFLGIEGPQGDSRSSRGASGGQFPGRGSFRKVLGP